MSQASLSDTPEPGDFRPWARWRRWWVTLACTVALGLCAPSARAWSGSEHIRHVDQAYQVMNILRRGTGELYALEAGSGQLPLSQCPASVCTPALCSNGCPLDPNANGNVCAPCAKWHRFINQVKAAPPKLDRIKTDLVDPPAALHAPNCAGVIPNLPAGDLAQCNAGDLPFAPRRGWHFNDNECYLRPGYVIGGADQNPAEDVVQPFFHELPSNYTGAVLGQWGTRPDDELNDTLVWIRPSHTLIFGETINLAESIADAGLAIAIAPIFCIADLIFGGGDCVADAVQGGKDLDLLNLADEGVGLVELYTAGQKTFTSKDFPVGYFGISLAAYFHFANVNDDAVGAAIPGNQFNILPGFKEIDGGATSVGVLDALDVAVIAATDLLGVTVHPYKSNGVGNYGAFADGESRSVGDWINFTIGHVEFEPVQNLAAYGWSQFRNGDAQGHKGGARGMGWVMHAIGDASQPHHTISALGWGHDWWETFANLSWQFNFGEDSAVRHYPDLVQTLAYGFDSWSLLDTIQQGTGSSDLDVRFFIQTLARTTHDLPVSSVGAAFVPGISMQKLPSPTAGEIHSLYDSETFDMKDLMERTIGASLGFLTKASDLVPNTPSKCVCPPGSSRIGQDAAGDFLKTADGACHPCGGAGPFQNSPSLVDNECVAVCPPDQPTRGANGVCTSAGACPPGKPFEQNGTCVATCPAGNIVLNDRDCVPGNTCPAGMDKRSPNICEPTPKVPGNASGCGSNSADQTTCTVDTQCCSHSCNKTDGVCRSRTGETCFTNGDCISNNCANANTNHGVCQPGQSGDACTRAADCANGECLSTGRCNGLPGDTCSVNGDCMSRSQCTEGHTCCIPDGQSCDTNGSFCCGSCDQSTSTPGVCLTSLVIP